MAASQPRWFLALIRIHKQPAERVLERTSQRLTEGSVQLLSPRKQGEEGTPEAVALHLERACVSITGGAGYSSGGPPQQPWTASFLVSALPPRNGATWDNALLGSQLERGTMGMFHHWRRTHCAHMDNKLGTTPGAWQRPSSGTS